jgi:predicted dehydrogenase
MATRRPLVRISDTGEMAGMTSPDQVLVSGVLESGAPIAIHYRGGMPRGTGFLWEINGTEGDLRVTGAHGLIQLGSLAIEGATGADEGLGTLAVPDRYRSSLELPLYAENVAATYAMLASDVRDGTRNAPSFADAVETHRLCDAIERSAAEGRRVTVQS